MSDKRLDDLVSGLPNKPSKSARVLHVRCPGVSELQGHYSELGYLLDGRPCFRKISEDGFWLELLLRWHQESTSWCFVPQPEGAECLARGRRAEGKGICTWEVLSGSSEVELTLVSVGLKLVTKKEMKLAFEKRLQWQPSLLRCRAEDCPKACRSREAKEWGFRNQKDLFGHLCFYHRSAGQYYELQSLLYNPQAIDELQAKDEGTEKLLEQFRKCLFHHDYQEKAETQGPEHHVKNLRHIVLKAQQDLQHGMDFDGLVLEVKGWREDQTSKGHFSTSLRWFKKWTEVRAVEYAVDHELKPCPPPVEAPLSKRKQAPVPDAAPAPKRPKVEEAKLEKVKILPKFLNIARAEDPIFAAVKAFRNPDEVAEPPAGPQLLSKKRKSQPSTAGEESFSDLGRDVALISAAQREVAEQIAARVEAGPARALFLAQDPQTRLEECLALDELKTQEVWLWCFVGLAASARRAEILETLCLAELERTKGASLPQVFVKLLFAARSPFGLPDDVVASLGQVLAGRLPQEAATLVPVKPLAQRGFDPEHHQWPAKLREPGPILLKAAAFAGLLAKIARLDARFNQEKALAPLRLALTEGAERLSPQQWVYFAVVFAALLWGFAPEAAFDELMALLPPKGALPAVRTAFQNLQRWAKDKAHRRPRSPPRLEPGPVLPRLTEAAQVHEPPAAEDMETAPAVEVGQTLPQPRVEEQHLPQSQPAGLEVLNEAALDDGDSSLANPPIQGHTEGLGRPSVLPTVPTARAPLATPSAPSVALPATTAGGQGKATVPICKVAEAFGRTVVGRVVRKTLHGTGGGCTVLLKDATGEVHVKLWGEAARLHRDSRELQPGREVQLEGFKLKELRTEKELQWAPSGRRHELVFDNPRTVKITAIGGLQERPLLSLAQLGQQMSESQVKVAAFVISLGELEDKSRGGAPLLFRQIQLGEGPTAGNEATTLWTLWGETAQNFSKGYLGQRILIDSTVRRFQGRLQLNGLSGTPRMLSG